MDFFRSLDVSLIILSCLQNSRKLHESIIRGFGRGISPKIFVRKSVKEAKFHKMCHFKILAWKVKKSPNLTYVLLRKVKLFHKNFSLRSQRVSLASSKAISKKNQKPPLQTPITGTRCEHDWNVFVTKFLKGLQNCLKIRSSCDLTC